MNYNTLHARRQHIAGSNPSKERHQAAMAEAPTLAIFTFKVSLVCTLIKKQFHLPPPMR